MPVTASSSMDTIISTLQGLEIINAKADLVSVIGAPASSGDVVSQLVADIQTAKDTLASKQSMLSSADALQSLASAMQGSGDKVKFSDFTLSQPFSLMSKQLSSTYNQDIHYKYIADDGYIYIPEYGSYHYIYLYDNLGVYLGTISFDYSAYGTISGMYKYNNKLIVFGTKATIIYDLSTRSAVSAASGTGTILANGSVSPFCKNGVATFKNANNQMVNMDVTNLTIISSFSVAENIGPVYKDDTGNIYAMKSDGITLIKYSPTGSILYQSVITNGLSGYIASFGFHTLDYSTALGCLVVAVWKNSSPYGDYLIRVNPADGSIIEQHPILTSATQSNLYNLYALTDFLVLHASGHVYVFSNDSSLNQLVDLPYSYTYDSMMYACDAGVVMTDSNSLSRVFQFYLTLK